MARRYPLLASWFSPALLIASLALPAAPVGAVGGVGDLYVTSDASNLVRAYNGLSGAYLGVHCASVAPPSAQLAIHFGETNNRVLVGHFGGGVNEFDATTGAFIKTYNPGGGWMWSALYRPNGNVLATDSSNDQVVEYDGTTGAFLSVFATFPPGSLPSDMRFGPNGNLYVCAYGTGAGLTGMVYELHPVSGATVTAWSLPNPGERTNDIAFLPNGEILVTVMGSNLCHRFDSTPVHNLLGSFAGTGWDRPHGIDISPANGHIYIADGVTTQVHEFDPLTFAEITPAFLTPGPGDKIVDLEFRRSSGDPTPATPSTWGRIKTLYQ
jgi:DNA-binding beta-propeller fold protein YncE